MATGLLNKVFGTKSDREVKSLYSTVEEINAIFETLGEKSDEELVFTEERLLKAPGDDGNGSGG